MANIFEVNSAIEQVIAGNGNDKEAAAAIIQYAQTLPETRVLKDTRTSWRKKKGGSLSGFTKEVGNVTLKEDEKSEEKKEWFDGQKARVGHYRMWRAFNMIFFHHYWASDVTTSNLDGERPEIFVLGYNLETLEMDWLAKIAYEAEWHRAWWLFKRQRQKFLVMLDREHEGQQRPFGRQIFRGFNRYDAEQLRKCLSTPEGKCKAGIYGAIIGAILGTILGIILIIILNHLFP